MKKEKMYLCSECVEENDTPFSLDISTKLVEVEPRYCEACDFRETMELIEENENEKNRRRVWIYLFLQGCI